MKRQSLICVYTGNGKGKTTAALGMLLRASGHDLRCAVVQFIKSDPSHWGEYASAQKLGISWENFGEGFTWDQEDLSISEQVSKDGWQKAQEMILEGSCDALLLDEIAYPMTYGWISSKEAAAWLEEHREQLPILILTGREMPQEMIRAADMVSEIKEIKHHFNDKGLDAMKGVEF